MDANQLTELYLVEKLSSTQIAELCKCHPSTILSYLKKAGIKIRSQSEQKKLYPNPKLRHNTPHTEEARRKMSVKVKASYANGKVPWNKGRKGVYSVETLKKMSISNLNRNPEAIKKMAETLKKKYASGEIKINVAHLNTPEINKKRTEILRQRIASGEIIREGFPKGTIPWNKGLKMSDEYKSKSALIPRNHIKTPEEKAKLSASVRRAFAEGRLVSPMKNPESVKKMLHTLGKSPNKAELRLNKILNNLYPLEFKFVGDGEFIIGGRCPDFLNVNGKKIIIELFGEPFHDPNHKYTFGNKKFGIGRTNEATIAHYENYGFSTLVIWYKELTNEAAVCDKIKTFMEANNYGDT